MKNLWSNRLIMNKYHTHPFLLLHCSYYFSIYIPWYPSLLFISTSLPVHVNFSLTILADDSNKKNHLYFSFSVFSSLLFSSLLFSYLLLSSLLTPSHLISSHVFSSLLFSFLFWLSFLLTLPYSPHHEVSPPPSPSSSSFPSSSHTPSLSSSPPPSLVVFFY